MSDFAVLRIIVYRFGGYLFPLITIPICSRLLGTTGYGQLGVVLSFCSLLQAFCEYGHSVSGAKELAETSSEHAPCQISDQILWQKLALLLFSFLIGLLYFTNVIRTSGLVNVFFMAFIFIVIPDALSPVWLFFSKGAVAELVSYQFIAKIVAIIPIVLLLWLFPYPFFGAIAVGLPFCINFILTARYAVRDGLFKLPDPKLLRVLSSNLRGNAAVFVGSFVASTLPAISIQMVLYLHGSSDLGVVYLAISLWVACKQLCMLPIQSVFYIAARKSSLMRMDLDEITLVRKARRYSFVIAILIIIGFYSLGEGLLGIMFGSQYANASKLLALMLLSLMPFSIGYSYLLNEIAAFSRKSEYPIPYIVATLSFVAYYVLYGVQLPDHAGVSIGLIIADSVFMIVVLLLIWRGRIKSCE